MSFDPNISLGNILTIGGVALAAIVAWVKRDKDVEFISTRIEESNASSLDRYEKNAARAHELEIRVQQINEKGSPACIAQIENLRIIVADHALRICSLESLKEIIARLDERSETQCKLMEEMKMQLKELLKKNIRSR